MLGFTSMVGVRHRCSRWKSEKKSTIFCGEIEAKVIKVYLRFSASG